MRRVALLLVAFVLSVNFSGMGALLVPEPCSITEESEASDSACPPSCVRCGCCSQPIVAALTVQFVPRAASPAATVTVPDAPLLGDIREILHVPKSAA
ncbi:MAG: hypothetical protein IPL75_11070 [Acidobacteria bacterium]|nr:hypothetical protein [Acidobacteriota bacterium]